MPEQNLFNEFQNVSTEDWLLQIEKDLKGKDFKNLLSISKDGITVKPIYHQESTPKAQDFKQNAEWKIVQEILVMDNKEANKQALIHLNKGASSLLFYLAAPLDLDQLLDNIQIQFINVHFVTEGKGLELLKALENLASKRGINAEELNGSINIDCLENLSRTGNWFKSEMEDFSELQGLQKSKFPNIKTLCVNANLFSNAGANHVQELGFTLAIAYEYIQHLKLSNGSGFWFNFGIGSDFFAEISKLRAFRRLWSQLQEELSLDPHPAHIYTENSSRNKTILDAHNNLIRTTTEAMAAVIGGCDELSIKGYNMAYSEANEFSERIAKNQQSILEHESHFSAVNDIAKGSHYIESYTEDLANKAWEYFKLIESQGGYLAALKSGWLQSQIEEVSKQEQQQFDDQNKILIGANKHQNKTEDIKDKIDTGLFYKEASSEKIVEPVKVKRLSEELEK